MSQVSLGENSKLTALPSERDRVRKFYREVLGCAQTGESERLDVFEVGENFNLGVLYDDAALSLADRMKSIWLELRADDPESMKLKILDFGIGEIDYFDKAHFYFQAPGGQVYRLIGARENMSKWRR
jgi:hypothetical protein